MNIAINLESVKIPPEFVNKTAFLFEVKDNSFIHLGIDPDSVALVDNSKEFSTKYPIAFILKDKTFVGLPEKIAEDLFYLENKVIREEVLLFSVNEINLIGQVRGIFRQNKLKTGFVFERF